MKKVCPLGYHHNGVVTTHVFGHMMYCACAQVHEMPQNHCGDNRECTLFSALYIYIHIIYICIYIYIIHICIYYAHFAL